MTAVQTMTDPLRVQPTPHHLHHRVSNDDKRYVGDISGWIRAIRPWSSLKYLYVFFFFLPSRFFFFNFFVIAVPESSVFDFRSKKKIIQLRGNPFTGWYLSSVNVVPWRYSYRRSKPWWFFPFFFGLFFFFFDWTNIYLQLNSLRPKKGGLEGIFWAPWYVYIIFFSTF